jgi:hypothetical protein
VILAWFLALVVAAPPGEQVVAKVGAVELRRADLDRRLAAISAQGRTAKPEVALDGLITETLLAEEGRRLGLAGTPAVAQMVDEQVRRAAAAAFTVELAAKAEVSDAQLRDLFHSTADLLTFDTLIYASREDAAAALQRLSQGARLESEVPRAVIARIFATPAEAKPITRAQLEPALATALVAASPGQLVGPVEGQNGWVVARLLKKELGTEAAFAARRASLTRFGKAQAAEQAKRHLVAQRRAKAGVTVDEPFLAATRGLEASPAQLDHPVAQVGGAPIRYRELVTALSGIAAAGGHGGASLAMKQQVLSSLVDERLLQDLALERGSDRAPEVVARRPDFERAALAQAAAQRILDGAPAPSETEIEDFYRANAAAFGRPFEEVLPAAAARAAEKKRAATLEARLKQLRKAASVSIDRSALPTVAPGEAR